MEGGAPVISPPKWSVDAATEEAITLLLEWVPDRQLAYDVLDAVCAALERGGRYAT